MNYAIRLTRTYSEIESLVKGLDDVPYIVVYQHLDGARPHCHILLKNCPVKTTTLKARINKALGKIEKTDWSFVTSYNGNPVDDKVLTYFSKGVLEPSYVKGFTQEQIDGYKSEWVVKETKPRGSSNKITYNDIIKELIAEMTEQDNERRELGKVKNFITYRDVPRMVLAKLRKYEIVCGRYKARDLVDTVMNRYEFPEFVESFEGMCSFLTK